MDAFERQDQDISDDDAIERSILGPVQAFVNGESADALSSGSEYLQGDECQQRRLELVPQQRSNYHLRQGDCRNPGYQTVWVDNDDSGNFDPSAEHQLKPSKARPARRTVLRRNYDEEEGEEASNTFDADEVSSETSDTDVLPSIEEVIVNFIVILKFASESGKASFREKIDGFLARDLVHPNPEDSSAAEPTNTCGRRSLRESRRTGAGPRRQDYPDIVSGHPAVRGCVACYAAGQNCSMLVHTRTYPCAYCAENDLDCELFIQPKRKRACESCVKIDQALDCSYVLGLKHHDQPCQECQRSGSSCFAGPAEGHELTRYDLTRLIAQAAAQANTISDVDDEKAKKRKRKGACHHCARLGIDCSSQSDEQMPCSYCKTNDLDCKEQEQPKRKRNKKKTGKVPEWIPLPHWSEVPDDFGMDAFRSRASTPESITSEMERNLAVDPGPARNHHKTIFCCDMPPHNEPDCDWCGKPCFGVHDYRRDPNARDSRMCLRCTSARIDIIACETHKLFAIPGMPTDDSEMPRLKRLLDRGWSSIGNGVKLYWCTFCAEPARYGCGSGSNAKLHTNETKTCGLQVCKNCAKEILIQGDMTEVLNSLAQQEAGGHVKLRADIHLLHSDPEMLAAVERLMNQ